MADAYYDGMQYYGSPKVWTQADFMKVLLPNFWFDNIFTPGTTFTQRFITKGGRLYLYKQQRKVPGLSLPAEDFEHEKVDNDLIPFNYNNTWRMSEKIYDVQAQNVPYDMLAATLEIEAQGMKEAWGQAAIACLLNEASSKSFTIDGGVDQWNVKETLLDWCASMYARRVHPKVCICTPEMYAKILKQAGTQFTPVTNERMLNSAEVGEWLGLRFIQTNMFFDTQIAYIDNKNESWSYGYDTLQKVEGILYDPAHFSVGFNFTGNRIVDHPDFFGSLVQSELQAGFLVTASKAVCVISTDPVDATQGPSYDDQYDQLNGNAGGGWLTSSSSSSSSSGQRTRSSSIKKQPKAKSSQQTSDDDDVISGLNP
jgi:hypothetical protein